MRKEYSNVLYTQNMVSSLFFNASVKANVTRKEYNEVKKKVDSLEQKDLKEANKLALLAYLVTSFVSSLSVATIRRAEIKKGIINEVQFG